MWRPFEQKRGVEVAWQFETARQRIRALIKEAPAVNVRRFSDEYMPLYEARKAASADGREPVSAPLFDLQTGTAVLVDTVQIYIQILNYEEHRIEEGRETEASHERALRFLHLYYSACDRVVEQGRAQRVDYHGARMHAVVLDQAGAGITVDTIADALGFIRDFELVASQANKELAGSEFAARFRIGVDIGRCVAINNGTGLEQEPMFLGGAANHAAKLAEGDKEGIFVSDRVRVLLGLQELGIYEKSHPVDDAFVSQVIQRREEEAREGLLTSDFATDARAIVESWRDEIRKKEVPDPTTPRFAFHYKEPPLSEIKYQDLSPSQSIRMPLASVFADLSGYTAYIDDAIAKGRIAEAVRALYVMRAEFQNVVEEDFGGRKVRFIGDCIHALLAKGSRTETDDKATVVLAFECAGGLRSSFRICQDELKGIDNLGLAIGVEYGWTPVSRIGIRGVRSVRLATSVATATSEKMQQECIENETRFGPAAMELVPAGLHDLADDFGVAGDMTYDDVVTSVSSQPAEVVVPAYVRRSTPTAGSVSRAHFRKT